MIDLLVIADDFTGALDTGVQFAQNGIVTDVMMNNNFAASDLSKHCKALVINTDSRHLSPEKAYQIVCAIVILSRQYGVPHVYKKTDSGLRGNIGSELTALLDATQKMFLPFIPAYPQINRITRDGIQYIDNAPIAESVFGQDPFNPVRYSYVPDIIHQQSEVKTCIISKLREIPEVNTPTIGIYDSITEAEEAVIADNLFRNQQLAIMAGCAGFASVIPAALGMKRQISPCYKMAKRVLVVNGSLNPITRRQIDYAEKNGFHRIVLSDEDKTHNNFDAILGQDRVVEMIGECCKFSRSMIDGSGLFKEISEDRFHNNCENDQKDIQKMIPVSLGRIVQKLLEKIEITLFVIGGDTLLGIMDQFQIKKIMPIMELDPGAVISTFWWKGKEHYLVSRSGGMGTESNIVDITEKVILQEEKKCGKSLR